MFALRLFGFRLSVAADDLAIPAQLTLLLRVPWVAAVAVFTALALGGALDGCLPQDAAALLLTFTIVLLFVAGLTLLTTLVVLISGNRGALLEPEKRWAVLPAVNVLFVLYALQAIDGLFGALFLALAWPRGDDGLDELDDVCADNVNLFLIFTIVAVVLSLLDVFGFFVFWLLVLNRNKLKIKTGHLRLDEFDVKSLEWQARCRRWCEVLTCLTCGLFGYHPIRTAEWADGALSHIGEVFASFFTAIRITPTELLAGLLLVRAEQTEKRRAAEAALIPAGVPQGSSRRAKSTNEYQAGADRKSRITPKLERLDSSNRVVSDTDMESLVKELMHLSRYSDSINTWKLHIFNSLHERKAFSAARGLIKQSIANARLRAKNRDMHRGDNCFACNHTAYSMMSGIDAKDIVFTSFASYVNELIAFAVAVDHKHKTVVLNFRGSLSLADLATDAVLEPESLAPVGERWGFDGKGHYAHTGMLNAALKIRAVLEERGLLNRLFRRVDPKRFGQGDGAAGPSMEDWERHSVVDVDDDQLPDCRGYQLICIGTSLGAGVSAIMTVLLRPAFPDVRGYGLSTPGCIFSRELAEETSAFFTTVFVGKDLVPRASWRALDALFESVLDALRRCKVNKNVVLKSLYKGTAASDMLYAPEEVPDSPGVRLVDEMRAKYRALAEGRASRFASIKMYCPGRILQLAKTHTESTAQRSCLSRRRVRFYEPFWIADRDDLTEVTLSPSMVADHMPHRVTLALANVADNFDFHSPVQP